MVKVTPWQCPSLHPAPPQGASGGSRQLGTPRARPSHWDPSHRLGCSHELRPKSPITLPLTIQAFPFAVLTMNLSAAAAVLPPCRNEGRRVSGRHSLVTNSRPASINQ